MSSFTKEDIQGYGIVFKVLSGMNLSSIQPSLIHPIYIASVYFGLLSPFKGIIHFNKSVIISKEPVYPLTSECLGLGLGFRLINSYRQKWTFVPFDHSSAFFRHLTVCRLFLYCNPGFLEDRMTRSLVQTTSGSYKLDMAVTLLGEYDLLITVFSNRVTR